MDKGGAFPLQRELRAANELVPSRSSGSILFFRRAERELSPFAIFGPRVNYTGSHGEKWPPLLFPAPNPRHLSLCLACSLLYLHIDTKAIELPGKALPFL